MAYEELNERRQQVLALPRALTMHTKKKRKIHRVREDQKETGRQKIIVQ